MRCSISLSPNYPCHESARRPAAAALGRTTNGLRHERMFSRCCELRLASGPAAAGERAFVAVLGLPLSISHRRSGRAELRVEGHVTVLRSESVDPARPFANLLPLVSGMVERGNTAIDGSFMLNPDDWRCRMLNALDFDLIAGSSFFPAIFTLPLPMTPCSTGVAGVNIHLPVAADWCAGVA